MVDILNLSPHKVSRDLRGYSILIYGDQLWVSLYGNVELKTSVKKGTSY